MSGCRIGRVKMKAGGADVRVLRPKSWNDAHNIPGSLRMAARNIEQMEVQPRTALFIIRRDSGQVALYGWGPDANAAEAIVLSAIATTMLTSGHIDELGDSANGDAE